ncbi:probable Ankyrin-3 at C-terminar half [Coccomyxa sp. Obi]|nr:probable Ankyrin-3 at C-terminar half [Coccomyxa sp. Obi]
MSRRLNPHAPVFVPQSFVLSAHTTKFAFVGADLNRPCNSSDEGNEHHRVLEVLPDEILTYILVKLDDPTDVAASAGTCKRLRSLSVAAPLQLRVGPSRFISSREQGTRTGLRTFMLGLSRSFRGVRELNLRGLPIELDDLMLVVQHLPSLCVIHLSGAQKLPPTVSALFSKSTREPDAQACGSGQIEAASLARCFQLTSEALSDALRAAACPSSRLRTIALSHLDLSSWPPAPPAEDASSPHDEDEASGRPLQTALPLDGFPPVGRLKILSLHNCAKISGSGLAALGRSCPQLHMLLLGGCTLAPSLPSGYLGPHQPAATEGFPSPRAAGPLRVIGVVDEGLFFPGARSGLQMLREAVEGSCAGRVGASAGAVELLCGIVRALPHLRVLELTHFSAAVVDGVRALCSTTGKPALEVWDLCRLQSVQSAQGFLRQEQQKADGRGMAGDIALALQEAVNCSSLARQTPLHAAAETGNAVMVKALLSLGAAVNARDRSGGTPLSVTAEEAGRTGAAAALLAAGADVRAKNAAGEAPLYIASLRGHVALVQLLLQFHERQGISWTDTGLYGDGWTPLMAAAVAGRQHIAMLLLQRAGTAAMRLVQAANRYGLTATHIAARSGNVPLLCALLEVGGGSIANAQDGSGETPIDVAHKYGNVQAARLLRDALHFPPLHPDHHCGAHAQALSLRLSGNVRRRAQQPHLV